MQRQRKGESLKTIDELREWLKNMDKFVLQECVGKKDYSQDFIAGGLRVIQLTLKKLDELEANQTTVDGCFKCHCIRCGESGSSMCPHCGDGEEEESEYG